MGWFGHTHSQSNVTCHLSAAALFQDMGIGIGIGSGDVSIASMAMGVKEADVPAAADADVPAAADDIDKANKSHKALEVVQSCHVMYFSQSYHMCCLTVLFY